MFKHLIYIVLFFSSTSVISQTASYKPIIEINKTWDEIYVGNPPGITGIDGAERFHIGRDTMINSLIYHFVDYQVFLPQNPGPFWFPLYLVAPYK
ncbi:MAG: hypothetical protein A3K10_05655 [Bacteroidetes bacterium RIFCSPLOWO2_12_FULL_31_6]|nr:MAG: hypothetical protein A3K10_05655 [Bacteroidetes bacterium RIFCSPLOWO2_12_FULL_31_6]